VLGSNSFPVGSNSSISKPFKMSTSFCWVSMIPMMKGSFESGYSLTASFLHRLIQSAASSNSLANLVTEYFLLSSTYLSFMANYIPFGSDLDPLQLLLLFFNVFDEFELLEFNLLGVFFEEFHLVGHLLEFCVVGFDPFLLLFDLFLSNCEALLGSEFDQLIEIHVGQSLFWLCEGFLGGLSLFWLLLVF
jgi:hypothetical protein